ncbi:unnamed protein product [Allacma fusca]|uniref:Chromo domain-containing protein n=1 Tax=Allacma fusca TaxID=39272 RepID=A0A8J2L6P4_9HEXA|nr:unnamed protein product [Allacma fusca]
MVRTATKVHRYNAIRKQLEHDLRRAVLYEVEKIVDKVVVNGKIYYEVKWLGYDTSENTWQRPKSLKLCKSAIRDFERSLRKSTTKASRRQNRN